MCCDCSQGMVIRSLSSPVSYIYALEFVLYYYISHVFIAFAFESRYPTDTDKLMLAKQTGLSRSQVACLSFMLMDASIHKCRKSNTNFSLCQFFLSDKIT